MSYQPIAITQRKGRPAKLRISAIRPMFQSPFAPPGLVVASDNNGNVKLTVTPGAGQGIYTYMLAVNDGNGGIVTLDPQIIIN